MLTWILASNPSLRAGLVLQLSEGQRIARELPADPHVLECGDVVVAAEQDCPPQRCAILVSHGARVVVLGPLGRPAEVDAYMRAGAFFYLPMGGTAAELRSVVARARADAGNASVAGDVSPGRATDSRS